MEKHFLFQTLLQYFQLHGFLPMWAPGSTFIPVVKGWRLFSLLPVNLVTKERMCSMPTTTFPAEGRVHGTPALAVHAREGPG